MNITLAENIRTFRRARQLTQEQLAEALGVTAGAVYKWEAKLSTPDVNLIIELADLFDVSVDVLLGYEVRSNKEGATVERLKELMLRRDERAFAEADKALVRYPNSFNVVYRSAAVYGMLGLAQRGKARMQRGIELMERAVRLIGQNTDPEISESSIYHDMALIYFSMGKAEEAVELLKDNNPCHLCDAYIGYWLASVCDRPEEAEPYLSSALLKTVENLANVVCGYLNLYIKRCDFASAAEIVEMGLGFFDSLREPGKRSFLDKFESRLHIALAEAQLELGDGVAAREHMRSAQKLAEGFDRAPEYSADSIRFAEGGNHGAMFDDMGETAAESIRLFLDEQANERLTALWEEVQNEE